MFVSDAYRGEMKAERMCELVYFKVGGGGHFIIYCSKREVLRKKPIQQKDVA